MSNEVKMVSVPRELVEQAMLACFEAGFGIPHSALRDLLDAPAPLVVPLTGPKEWLDSLRKADQCQGEPATLPSRDESLGTAERDEYANGYRHGWNAYQESVAKLGPLYTHPAPAVQMGEPVGEVVGKKFERRWWMPQVKWAESFNAERTPVGTLLYTHADPEEVERLRALVKSYEEIAESHADACAEALTRLAERDALRSFADEIVSAAYEGGSFEGGDIQDMAVKHGLLRIESRAEECGEACACREYGFPAECYRKTGVLSASAEPSKIGNSEYSVAEPSAPVERDERAEFEADWAHRMKVAGHRERANAFYRIQPNDRYRWNDVQDAWEAWQARAALERKPK